MSDTPTPNLPPRRKLEIEQPMQAGSLLRSGAPWMYALATLALIGVAAYMALVEGRELLSPYVAGPAIGAVWFALRTFMTWGSNARG
ncbi:MAG: hypothetical protein K2X34_03645 [Hyphomonadaceae bacterium]|nr:hypothetical protein [Hyphomonadaceae bacterium]